ncbi:hypothetical protein D3C79_940860 [compost metagenome]
MHAVLLHDDEAHLTLKVLDHAIAKNEHMGAFAGAVAVGNHAIGVLGLVDGHGHGRSGDHEQAT